MVACLVACFSDIFFFLGFLVSLVAAASSVAVVGSSVVSVDVVTGSLTSFLFLHVGLLEHYLLLSQ